MLRLNREQLIEARAWLSDCAWGEEAEGDRLNFDTMSDRAIERGVARHFDGGINAFLETFAPVGGAS